MRLPGAPISLHYHSRNTSEVLLSNLNFILQLVMLKNSVVIFSSRDFVIGSVKLGTDQC